MSRVLIVLNDLKPGNGTASAILAYYDGLVQSGFEVDFLLINRESVQSRIDTYKNSKIYHIVVTKKAFTRQNIEYITRVFRNRTYDIIHVNTVGIFALQILVFAKKYGIQHRVLHSHSTIYLSNNLNAKGIFNIMINHLCATVANHYIACSTLAGKTKFGHRQFEILHNCIDVNRFSYNTEVRKQLRFQYSIPYDAFVVGTVARMSKEKNPIYSLKVFDDLLRYKPSSYFVWVGDGDMKNQIIEYAKEHNFEQQLLLTGTINDVHRWYSMMDCFILPSLYEGLPVVCVEAQAAGLKTYTSNRVPSDVILSPYISRLSINKPSEFWAKTILEDYSSSHDRNLGTKYIIESGFDLHDNKYQLSKIYMSYL